MLSNWVLLREEERVTGPVEHNPSGVGPVDVDPLDPVPASRNSAPLEQPSF